jgi:CheY-like chemotaxis protein
MWRDRSVLIVEDDETVRRVLLQALELELGATAVAGIDGAEALEWARTARPAVVLLDLMLPQLDGFDVARHLRAGRLTADARIVGMSAMTPVDAVRERALGAGCDAFVAKPFRLEELLDLVHRYLLETDAEREADRRAGG